MAARRDHEKVESPTSGRAGEDRCSARSGGSCCPTRSNERTAYHEVGPRAPRPAPARGRPRAEGDDRAARPRARSHVPEPDGDRYGYEERYLRARIVSALGGRAAEQIVYGDVTTGAETDLKQVTASPDRW